MNLIATIAGLDEFVYVDTVANFLAEIGVRPGANEPASFQEFIKSTLLILERDKQKNKEEFFATLRRLRATAPTTQNIQNFVKQHLNQVSGDVVESKGLENVSSSQGNNFNITLRILVGPQFETLLKLLGEGLLQEIFNNFCILHRDK